MRVEAKDRKNPSLICVATIVEVRNRRLLVHFDGWSDKYNYWCSPDTTDIHPPMWCGKNGKKVEPPYGTYCLFVGELACYCIHEFSYVLHIKTFSMVERALIHNLKVLAPAVTNIF